MGTEENGLTLEGLVKRLEALEREHAEKLQTLERENERMHSENAELRDEVRALRDSQAKGGEVTTLEGSESKLPTVSPQPKLPEEPEVGRVSRKWLLSKAGAAAAGLVVAGVLTQRDIREAKAATTFGQIICTHNESRRAAVEGNNNAAFGYGVWGNAGTGVYGTSNVAGSAYGVMGHNTSTIGGGGGVYGVNESGPGVRGWGKNGGSGVVGDGTGTGVGVLGRNSSGTGVRGESSTVGHAAVVGKHSSGGFDSIGVKGETTEGVGVKGIGKNGVIGESPTLGHAAVYGQHTGQGYGVVGDGVGPPNAGVLGRNSDGSGVRGEGRNGVHGKGSNAGYGGLFQEGKAQLRIVPKGTAGKPKTGAHKRGEIYMDSAGTLFVCTNNGTPGTWRKVSTTAV